MGDPVPDQLVRVGTYNIKGPDGDRAARQVAMIGRHDLDVLMLQECRGTGWDPDGELLTLFHHGLGMVGAVAASRADDRRTALLWRPGRVEHVGVNDYSHVYWRSFAQHRLLIDGVGRINAMSVHAHHANTTSRAAEAEHMPRLGEGGVPAVLGGDWNSVHGRPAGRLWEHHAEPDPEPDIDLIPRTRWPAQILLDDAGDPVLGADGRPVFDRRPSKRLAIGGFRDAVAELLPPVERPATGGYIGRDAPRRLDRIYYTESGLEPVSVHTVPDPQGDLSDHCLVTATFRPRAGPGTG